MSLDSETRGIIDDLLSANKVVLFMKGTPQQPQCGFSAKTTAALDLLIPDFMSVNVLEHPTIREGIKEYSNWPTIPQLYIDGELIGGSDIILDMLNNGDQSIQVNESFAPLLPKGRYRNNWYQVGNDDNCYFALGIHGQWLFINPASSVVIAKVSSQPEPLDDALDFQTLRVFTELSRELGN
jgi:Grx4 family monothiol glutaredoxin